MYIVYTTQYMTHVKHSTEICCYLYHHLNVIITSKKYIGECCFKIQNTCSIHLFKIYCCVTLVPMIRQYPIDLLVFVMIDFVACSRVNICISFMSV